MKQFLINLPHYLLHELLTILYISSQAQVWLKYDCNVISKNKQLKIGSWNDKIGYS